MDEALLQCGPPRRAGVGRAGPWCRSLTLAGFNAARPEGRESADGGTVTVSTIDRLQCCPPRRAGVGPPAPVLVVIEG